MLPRISRDPHECDNTWHITVDIGTKQMIGWSQILSAVSTVHIATTHLRP